MSLVLNTKSNASRVLKLVLCPHVPRDLRLCVVTMVGRWCVLVQSQGLLPCIVDMAYQRTGQVPQLEFLPKVPIGLQVQNETDPTHAAYFYMPKDVCELAEIDTNGTSVAEDFCTSAPHSDKSDPTLLDLHSMHTCALELHALGTRLTNTLRTMRADKDPQLDPTIQDTTGQLNAAYTQLLDHSRTLNTVYTQTNNVLQVAADEATKSLAFYNTAIQCHKDWVGSRNVGFEGQAGGSNYARAWQPNEPVTIKAGLERVSTKARGKMAAE
ncbi:hypothetical protein IWW43_003130 [Coemansia sp. RSA 1935]|nr:hypothetical protein J3F82_003232 [Coemansia sp. RSA 637]KAJ2257604.1 hypothetical protein GGH98_000743 [Coemansia sp. RSA 454]KAJ2420534.1 hypothetical protein GGF47_004276 [Coemansia sp. RSA 2524]KAJ2442979.1 hypothetical protein IWW46_002753 [Coemansia sp. RSA 2440]KAJ2531696.1 hypothetical protein GGH20_001410 [Coemansia sp. RSA 1937]KAJ2532553.1 hypothetical protein IWW43_003130 [Coemansia sp. RSA 1935]